MIIHRDITIVFVVAAVRGGGVGDVSESTKTTVFIIIIKLWLQGRIIRSNGLCIGQRRDDSGVVLRFRR